MSQYEVTIIGAGLSGIIAAQRLKQQGRNHILLVDQGDQVGGRLGTRRLPSGKIDTGAQFFTVRTDEFREEVQNWLDRGWVKHWFGDKYPRYTAVDGMYGLAEQLSEGIPVSLKTKVTKIEQSSNGYRVFDEQGNDWFTEKLLLTMPAPEIIKLLNASHLSVSPSVIKRLKMITFEPTYVGIYQFKEATRFPDDGHMDQNLPEGVERIVDHQKKGMSKEPLVSVYMTGDWSRRYFGEDYVLSLIREKVEDLFNWSQLESEQLKRWRYAQAKQVFKESYLDLSGDGCVTAAGDAFLRPNDKAGRTRIESAYLSGRDGAAYLSW